MRQRRWGTDSQCGVDCRVSAGRAAHGGVLRHEGVRAVLLEGARARRLDGSGVSVTVLTPGPTETSFDDRSGSNVNVLYKRLSEDDGRGGRSARDISRNEAAIDGRHSRRHEQGSRAGRRAAAAADRSGGQSLLWRSLGEVSDVCALSLLISRGETTQAVEVAEQLVCPVNEVNHHARLCRRAAPGPRGLLDVSIRTSRSAFGCRPPVGWPGTR